MRASRCNMLDVLEMSQGPLSDLEDFESRACAEPVKFQICYLFTNNKQEYNPSEQGT